MNEHILKGSKWVVNCIVILSIIIIIPCLGGIGIVINNMIIMINKSTENNDLLGDIIAIVGIGIFVLVFIIADIVVLIQYKYSKVIFTDEKLMMVYKGKIKVEILYENIEKITLGCLTTLIYCKKPFNQKGWNKGATTFSGNFSVKDHDIIRNVIMDYNYKNNSNIIVV